MKFRAHETFFIRKGWLNKGMKHIVACADLFSNRNINPMDTLGIGSNMVKSLRYWLQAVGVTEEVRSPKRMQALTSLGKIILKEDPYIEEMGTLWLLQYNLGRSVDLATSWYYFFNEFPLNEFTKEDFIIGITNFTKLHNETVSVRSIEDDFNCIINTYIPRYKMNLAKINPEDNMDCPLGELGLIRVENAKEKLYRKMSPLKDTISPYILIACILMQEKNVTEIPLQKILYTCGSVGRIFNLDTISLMDILNQAETQGLVSVVRTAGLDVLKIRKDLTYTGCILDYYAQLH